MHNNQDEVRALIRERHPKAVEFHYINGITLFRVVGYFGQEFEWSYAFDRPSSHFFYSLDSALLGALGEKYQGRNSQFAEFAERMLEIREHNRNL